MKSVLITGCSSGIGYCAAKELTRRGYRVFATARDKEDVARLAAEGLESLHLDLNSTDSIEDAVTTVSARTDGRLDALINNGAYGQPGAVEDLSRQVLVEQFDTNVFGTHELTCKVLVLMRANGAGRVIQISSVLGFVAMPFRGAYNASKYAIEGLTDTLRLELRDTGIHVILIQPGPIESRFRENALAAFHRNIDPEKSVHRETYAATEARLKATGGGKFSKDPQAVFVKIVKALESKRPSSHYRVTTPASLFAILKRLLPSAMLDRILAKAGA